MAKKEKSLDSEVDLIAFISLLSVMICSLLLTAIWVQIGTMDVKQAVGGQAADGKKTPSVWAILEPQGNLIFKLQDTPSKLRKWDDVRVNGEDGKINQEAVAKYVDNLKQTFPEMRTALIKPNGEAAYEQIIALMDLLKDKGLIDLGVSPL